MQPFRKIHEKVWVRDYPFKIGMVPLGIRMTAVVLNQNDIWLHSVGPVTSRDVEAINNLGSVSSVVAPNQWHHLYLDKARSFFPEADFFGVEGLDRKKSDFNFDHILPMDTKSPWPNALEVFPVLGMPGFNELVFFHRKSKTLIATDFLFNLKKTMNFPARIQLKIFGTYQKPASSRLFRMFIRDKSAFKESVEAILNLPVDKIIMAHGEPIEKNGQDILCSVYEPLLSRI